MPASHYAIKTGDTGPPLEMVLEDEKGVINLANATEVKLLMQLAAGGSTITKVATIVNAGKGEVRVKFTESDTAVAGIYNYEFKIKWNTGELDSVPNENYFTLVIEPSA